MNKRNYKQDARDAMVVTKIREQYFYEPRTFLTPPIPNNEEGRKFIAEETRKILNRIWEESR